MYEQEDELKAAMDYSYYPGEEYHDKEYDYDIYYSYDDDYLRENENVSCHHLHQILANATMKLTDNSLTNILSLQPNMTSKEYEDKIHELMSEYCNETTVMAHTVFKDKFVILALIIPIGLLFNLMSCAVFLRSRMQKSVTVYYFFALACADNIVLMGELLNWLNPKTSGGYITGTGFINTNVSACRLIFFLRYYGRLLSSWLVVTICIERFIIVTYPFKSSLSSTPVRAKVVIAGLSVACLIFTCPTFYMSGIQNEMCTIFHHYIGGYDKWIMGIIFAGELVIPSIIVMVFTILIIIRLRRARLQRMKSKEGQKKESKQRKDNQPTIALLAVSIAFVTLRTPYVIMYPLQNVLPHHYTYEQLKLFYGAFEITYVIAVTNYAVNFLLYIVTGRKFRKELAYFLLCTVSARDRTWSRSTRAYSISSQSTSLRRGSNGLILRTKNQALKDKSSSNSQETQF